MICCLFDRRKNASNDIIAMAPMNRRIRLVRPYERPGFGRLEETGRTLLSDVRDFPFDDGGIIASMSGVPGVAEDGVATGWE